MELPQVMLPDGRSVPMTDAFRAEINDKFSSMAVRPLRCLALAMKVFFDTWMHAIFVQKRVAKELSVALLSSFVLLVMRSVGIVVSIFGC